MWKGASVAVGYTTFADGVFFTGNQRILALDSALRFSAGRGAGNPSNSMQVIIAQPEG